MRQLFEVVQFEIRYQLRSPFFLGALLLFGLIHFLAITGTFIHIDNFSNQVAINSAYGILQIEQALFIFGVLPIVAFVVTAITRDFERATASLLFVTPISPKQFVLGRFLGALSLALLIGLAGLLGAMIGTFMPWLDQARIASFSLWPWTYILVVIILPNTFVLCAIFYSVAALTRSFALTFAAAMAFFVAEALLNLYANLENTTWAALADPSARITVAAETRYWTVAELNANIPLGVLLQNRLLWLTVSLLALLVLVLCFRLDLEEQATLRFKRRTRRAATTKRTTQPATSKIAPVLNFSPRASFGQFAAQLKMDLSCVFKSLLIYIIIALVIANMIGEFQGNVGLLKTPLYPLTSQMLPILRFGMLANMLLVALWYSAELIHRERTSGTSEIINASAFADWLMILSKTVTLCLVAGVLMLVAVLTLITRQAAAGYTQFELGLYLQSAFVYNGIYYFMLCILAVVIQAISPNKWVGLLLTLGANIALLSLEPMGYNHVLYNFSIPEAIYSDMNGFGHFTRPVFSLIAYWGAFCVLLLIAGHLLYPRGNYSAVRERLRDARTRLGPGVKLTAGLAALTFIGIGGWVFYNTNILNEYLTPNEQLQRKADYERNYGRYDNAPAPSYDSIDMAIDIFPEERRMESRGSAILGNHKKATISEFVVSITPVLHVNQLAVENATLVQSDPAQGFYLYRLDAPLAPGATVRMIWNATRSNQGFVAAGPDNELVANGTYLDTTSVMPIPGYDGGRRITEDAQRRQYGLPPAPRTPKLGDPEYADRIGYGLDSRTEFEVVLSTSADQIAVAPGVLQKEWQQEERRYFHYKAETPILPNLSFSSARYEVARDRWNDVELEIYYDPKHAFNINAMMSTAKRALEFFSTEYAPYQYSYLRILEYPRYRTAAKFHSGTVPYSEAIGFVADLREWENADYGVIHELAHMWWGERITGAQMQGRWMLTENMADYSALMLFREYYRPIFANRIARGMLDGYLNGRSQENEAELPVMYTENHGYLRAKGPLALYALQDIIGKDKVHQALRSFLREYSFQTSPCPTSRDLVNALRAEAGPEYQQLITDLFERIVLYDLQVDAAGAREVDGGYEVTIELTARQFEADGHGKEIEGPLDTWFDVALFPETKEALEGVTPLYIEKHRLHGGTQILTVRTATRPAIVALDPFHKMIERSADNNSAVVAVLPQ
ncbi:MAG TPA: ABC transporter permease subunit [Blastocatellia bacterium]|nr:ABC transporter permease subunit [Blastocatellia bacterium]